jgi:hypothetical protein
MDVGDFIMSVWVDLRKDGFEVFGQKTIWVGSLPDDFLSAIKKAKDEGFLYVKLDKVSNQRQEVDL